MDQSDKLEERQKMEVDIENKAKTMLQKNKVSKIDSFTGYFEFLHNNFYTPVFYEGLLYPSVTHAFQAARSNDERTRKAIINAENLKSVINIAKRIEEPENWNIIRLNIMERLIRDKFRRSKELQEKLKATGMREISMIYDEETPTNLFWGIVKSKGQNHLGRILMKLREDIKENNELINWITSSFDLVTDSKILPNLTLNVYKNNTILNKIELSKKQFYLLGSLPILDVQLEHPSISRFHAVIIADKNLGFVIVDLRSKAGTKIDGKLILDHTPFKLKDKQKLNFGQSTRDYIVNLDTSELSEMFLKEKKELEKEIEYLKKFSEPEKMDLSKGFENTSVQESNNIFIGNISYKIEDTDPEQILKILNEYGEVVNFKCPMDNIKKQYKGFAFAEYKKLENAKSIVRRGSILYKDNFLKVSFSNKDPGWNNNRNEEENNRKQDKVEYRRKMESNLKEINEKIEKRRQKKKKSESKSVSDSESCSSDSKSSSESESNSSSSTVKKNKSKKTKHRSRERDRSRSRRNKSRSRSRRKNRRNRSRHRSHSHGHKHKKSSKS